MILSLDTSTTVCSVALHQVDGTLLGCYELYTERTASSRLTQLVQDVVMHTSHTLAEITAIAVARGPGSYTGLRIGVSTAKGLAMALDKPLLSVNTLRAMAEQVRLVYPSGDAGTLFCPMIDARRMEVYCAVYDLTGEEVLPTAALILDENSFADQLPEHSILFFGDGAAKARPVLTHPNARFMDELVRPSARTVGTLAVQAYAAGQVENLATFEPYYLKEFRTTTPKAPTF